MGIPIISEEGISGGYSLVPDYFFPCIHLYDKEIILLELLLKMSPQFQLLDFEEETKSLDLKLSHICKKNDSMKNAFLPKMTKPTYEMYESCNNIVTASPDTYLEFAMELARCAGILENDAVENLVSWFKKECVFKMD